MSEVGPPPRCWATLAPSALGAQVPRSSNHKSSCQGLWVAGSLTCVASFRPPTGGPAAARGALMEVRGAGPCLGLCRGQESGLLAPGCVDCVFSFRHIRCSGFRSRRWPPCKHSRQDTNVRGPESKRSSRACAGRSPRAAWRVPPDRFLCVSAGAQGFEPWPPPSPDPGPVLRAPTHPPLLPAPHPSAALMNEECVFSCHRSQEAGVPCGS